MSRYIVQHRRGNSTEWADKKTIIPYEGEIVIEIDEENSLHKLKIGDGIHTYAELNYLQAGDEIVTQVLAETKPRVVTVELTTDWIHVEGEKYKQNIALSDITYYSRLDLQPDANMLAEFKQLGLVFVTENTEGIISVYSVGNKPSKSYTVQATIVETKADSKHIVGIPVGTPTAQADWNQTDETKADYIKNKPIYKNINQVEISEITWDGNTDNKLCIEFPIEQPIKWYKVSDLILSKYNLMNATVTYNDGTSSTIYENPLTIEDGLQYYPDESSPVFIIYGFMLDLIVVLEDNANFEGVVFPESGIYLFKCNDDIIRYITKIELAKSVVGSNNEKLQADWNQIDDAQASYIKNKPTVVEGGVYEWSYAENETFLGAEESSDGLELTIFATSVMPEVVVSDIWVNNRMAASFGMDSFEIYAKCQTDNNGYIEWITELGETVSYPLTTEYQKFSATNVSGFSIRCTDIVTLSPVADLSKVGLISVRDLSGIYKHIHKLNNKIVELESTLNNLISQ